MNKNFIDGITELAKTVDTHNSDIRNIKEYIDGYKKMEKSIILLGDKIKNMNTKINKMDITIENQKIIIKENENKINEQNKRLEICEIDVDSIKNTFRENSRVGRKVERLIHSTVYTIIPKNTTRDKLFHGNITRRCKAYLTNNLKVNSFWNINIKDESKAKSLIINYLTRDNIHKIMVESANQLFKEMENAKCVTNTKQTKFNLLNELLEEVGGDSSEI